MLFAKSSSIRPIFNNVSLGLLKPSKNLVTFIFKIKWLLYSLKIHQYNFLFIFTDGLLNGTSVKKKLYAPPY